MGASGGHAALFDRVEALREREIQERSLAAALALMFVLAAMIAYLTLAPIHETGEPGSYKRHHFNTFAALAFPLTLSRLRLTPRVVFLASAYGEQLNSSSHSSAGTRSSLTSSQTPWARHSAGYRREPMVAPAAVYKSGHIGAHVAKSKYDEFIYFGVLFAKFASPEFSAPPGYTSINQGGRGGGLRAPSILRKRQMNLEIIL